MTQQSSTNRRREDLGQPGPAMRALPNNRWRLFVETYLWETFNNPNKNNHGAQAAAARKAGFGGPRTKPVTFAQIGWKLLKDDRMVAAVAEESRKLLRAGAPQAVKAVHDGILNPNHPSHAKFVSMVLDRSDPQESKQLVEVTHRTLDPDQESLEELRALRMLDTPRPKLIELFGSNGLERLEHLEAADKVRRANEAKMIDGEVIDVSRAHRSYTMSDDAPDPQRLIRLARQTLSAAERRRKYQRIDFLGTDFWYPTQLAFFAAGSSGVHQRLIYSGSQTRQDNSRGGRGLLASDRALSALVARQAVQQTYSLLDRRRVGHAGARHAAAPTLRRRYRRGVRHRVGSVGKLFPQADHGLSGGLQAVDTFHVTHSTDGKIDGMSTATFKTFEMRREKLQSETVDLVWIDERPDEMVYCELFARTSRHRWPPVGELYADRRRRRGRRHLQVSERAIVRSRRISHHL